MCNHVAQSFVCVGCKQKHKLKGKTAACVRLLPLKWKKIAVRSTESTFEV